MRSNAGDGWIRMDKCVIKDKHRASNKNDLFRSSRVNNMDRQEESEASLSSRSLGQTFGETAGIHGSYVLQALKNWYQFKIELLWLKTPVLKILPIPQTMLVLELTSIDSIDCLIQINFYWGLTVACNQRPSTPDQSINNQQWKFPAPSSNSG